MVSRDANSRATSALLNTPLVNSNTLLLPLLKNKKGSNFSAVKRNITHLYPSLFFVRVKFDVVYTIGDCVACNPLVSVISSLGRDPLYSAYCPEVYVKPLSDIVRPKKE